MAIRKIRLEGDAVLGKKCRPVEKMTDKIHAPRVHGRSHAHTLDMTSGNPYALMIGFAMPVFLSQVFQQMYNTADAIKEGGCH